MKTVDLSTHDAFRSVLSYGPTRTGKTHWLASWPRPVILSPESEGGWETIRYMTPDMLYEPNVRPVVRVLERPHEMIEQIQALKAELIQYPGKFKTLGVDSLTFYAEFFFGEMERQAYASRDGKRPEGKLLYGDLGRHLQYVVEMIHALPVNKVWICLQKEPTEQNPIGGPLVPGSPNPQKFLARCNYILRHVKTPDGQYVIHTTPDANGVHPAGGRRPLPPIINPNYREFERWLQTPVEEILKMNAAGDGGGDAAPTNGTVDGHSSLPAPAQPRRRIIRPGVR